MRYFNVELCGESKAFLGGQRWQVGMGIKRRKDIEGWEVNTLRLFGTSPILLSWPRAWLSEQSEKEPE